MTVPFLLKLGQAFDIDLQCFAEDDEGRVTAQLREVFGDPLFARGQVSDQDIRDAAQASPALGDAVIRLFGAYRELLENTMNVAEGLGGAAPEDPPAPLAAAAALPSDEVHDFIQARSGYFPELEEAAEALWSDESLDADGLYEGLRAVLTDAHGLKVPHHARARHARSGPAPTIATAGGCCSPTRWRPRNAPSSSAVQVALLGWRELFDNIAEESGLQGEARHLLIVELAAYFAGACVMPYERFHEAAEALAYDIDLLSRRFGASFEHVCQRLIALQRSGAKGAPLFPRPSRLRGQRAAPFRCRRLSLRALRRPLPALGACTARFSLRARTVSRSSRCRTARASSPSPAPSHGRAPATRCPASSWSSRSAARCLTRTAWCMARALDLEQPAGVVPIGINCRLCDRADCTARAFPPPGRRLIVDENQQGLTPYFFA